MSRLINMVKKGSKWVAAGASTALMSTVAFAEDHSAAIQAAGTDGQTNVAAAVVAILAIAAVVTGVGLVIRLMTR